MTGITAAMASMNAVDTHCAVCSLTSKPTINRGMALIMMVSLRIRTNVAATSTRTTAGVRPGVAGPTRFEWSDNSTDMHPRSK